MFYTLIYPIISPMNVHNRSIVCSLMQYMFLVSASSEQHIPVSHIRQRHKDKGLITYTQELPAYEEPGERLSSPLILLYVKSNQQKVKLPRNMELQTSVYFMLAFSFLHCTYTFQFQ
jgi:hypothetical protein